MQVLVSGKHVAVGEALRERVTDEITGSIGKYFERGGDADVVVDCVGEKTWDASLKALRPMGRLVTCGATTGPHVTLDLRRMFWFQWSLLGSTMGSDREFREIVSLGERGRVRPVIDSVVPLAQGVRAFERMQTGSQLGKLVIEVSQ